jgi:CarD family transcriptional regulator
MARNKTAAKTAAAKKTKRAAGKAASPNSRARAAAGKDPARKLQAAKLLAKRSAALAAAKAEKVKKVPVAKGAAPAKSVAKVQPKAVVAAKPPVVPKAAAKPAEGVKAVLPKAPALKHPVAPPTAPAAVARSMAAAAIKTAQKVATPPATPKMLAEKAALARQSAAAKKPVNQRHGFKTNEWIVYPAHGVGRIVGIEEQEIAGISLELFVITFEKDKMTLRVPTGKSQSVGMRKLAEENTVKRAMDTLKGKARIKRTMWSRRAQEYEAKINSGDLISIAEVVRDLYRSESQPEQSYSERQLYEQALDRMAREIAAVEKLDERGAVQRITEVLSKSARGRRLAAEEAEAKAA